MTFCDFSKFSYNYIEIFVNIFGKFRKSWKDRFGAGSEVLKKISRNINCNLENFENS